MSLTSFLTLSIHQHLHYLPSKLAQKKIPNLSRDAHDRFERSSNQELPEFRDRARHPMQGVQCSGMGHLDQMRSMQREIFNLQHTSHNARLCPFTYFTNQTTLKFSQYTNAICYQENELCLMSTIFFLSAVRFQLIF